MNRVATQHESIEMAKRAHAAILADALVNGRSLFDGDGNDHARDLVTKAIVDLRRASGALPEVMCGALIEAAWTCQDEEQRRAYMDEARQIAAKTGSPSIRRTVFEATR
jgi:hypothetical protein